MKYPVKYSKAHVAAAIRKMAHKLKNEQIVNDNTIYLVMLNGGVWFAMKLFEQMGNMDNEVYFIKGHSYDGTNRQTFTWDYMPEIDLAGRDVVVIDDICDSGETLKQVYMQLKDQVHSVTMVTLMLRTPRALDAAIPLYTCIEDGSSKFFVGCGLDNRHHGRLLEYVGVC
ncbi:MAG: hypothetical protein MJZ65_06615 [Paludibacteraceae bacterium]|nr:hypothetical protein [Paludibacteraceae bacterium]